MSANLNKITQLNYQCHLTDPTQHIAFLRSGDDLVDGLFVELDAWQCHMFRVDSR
jgi:hypothetical protein